VAAAGRHAARGIPDDPLVRLAQQELFEQSVALRLLNDATGSSYVEA
jgi:hypothetical protein